MTVLRNFVEKRPLDFQSVNKPLEMVISSRILDFNINFVNSIQILFVPFGKGFIYEFLVMFRFKCT